MCYPYADCFIHMQLHHNINNSMYVQNVVSMILPKTIGFIPPSTRGGSGRGLQAYQPRLANSSRDALPDCTPFAQGSPVHKVPFARICIRTITMSFLTR